MPSGCNLQALAVEEHLRRHPGAIAISQDLKNAFNVLWSTVQQYFPKLEALIRLMYPVSYTNLTLPTINSE